MASRTRTTDADTKNFTRKLSELFSGWLDLFLTKILFQGLYRNHHGAGSQRGGSLKEDGHKGEGVSKVRDQNGDNTF